MAKKATDLMDYDKKSDSFYIYKNRQVKGDLRLGDFLVDLDFQDHVVGLEMLNASKVLKGLGITKTMLSQAKSAKLTAKYLADAIYIYWRILMPHSVEKSSMLTIPAPSAK